MGDKSPKSTRKQAQQKQVKTNVQKQRQEDIQTPKRPDIAKNNPGKSNAGG